MVVPVPGLADAVRALRMHLQEGLKGLPKELHLLSGHGHATEWSPIR